MVDLYQVDYIKSTLLILALWTFSGAASNLLMVANRSLNDFWELNERKLTRYSLPYSFCACAIGKSSSSWLILLRVRNSKTCKLLRRANLVGFVVVETWLPDVCGPRFSLLPDCLYTCFRFLRAHFLHDRSKTKKKYLVHFWWYIWTRAGNYHGNLKNVTGYHFLCSLCPLQLFNILNLIILQRDGSSLRHLDGSPSN